MSQSGQNADSASPSQPLRASTVGRQVKACSACRTTKIKCRMPNGPPCERCSSRGLNCQVEKTNKILEDTNKYGPHSDVFAFINHGRWQADMSSNVSQLQTAVNILLRMSNLPLLPSYNATSPASMEVASRADDEIGDEGGDESLPPAPILAPVAADDSLYSLPINSLYEVTRLPSLRNPAQTGSRSGAAGQDLISRGLISEAVAQQLFVRFTTRLDYFCYGILCPHETLESLRNSSPLLTAAICTVASMHDPEGSAACKVSHAEFLRLASANMFSISQSVDDVRALMVGVYWLGSVSYTLLGHAIRIAMRLNYHLAYFSVVNNTAQQDDVDKARLWYTLYILDHHASILYGRPAIISPNEEPHQQWELFIQVNGQQEVDLRMSSQVALYHIVAKVKDVFGGYSIKTVPEHSLPQLRNFFAELDRWYMVWGDRMPRNAHIGWFPRDGAILHYHFARLHLCSYIFRGMSLESSATASPQVRDYATVAITSATAVLEIVFEREHMRTALVGMPLYFHGMINFAAVFLIKATRTNFWGLTEIDGTKVNAVVQRHIRELRSQSAARQHLVYHLSNGLEDMMAVSRRLAEESEAQSSVLMPHPVMQTMDSMFVMDTFDIFQAPIDPQEMASMSSQEYHPQGDYEMGS